MTADQDDAPRATVRLEGEQLIVTMQAPELARKVALLARATRKTPERVLNVYWGGVINELENRDDSLEDCWFADDRLALACECIESALRHWAPACCWDWDMDGIDSVDDLVRCWTDDVDCEGWPHEQVKRAIGCALGEDFEGAWSILELVCKDLKIDAEHMPPSNDDEPDVPAAP